VESCQLVLIKERPIAKNQNTFAKRKREMDKKLKAEAKRIRRHKRKLGLEEIPPPDSLEGEPESPEDALSSNDNNYVG
jgi:hypothetical protein